MEMHNTKEFLQKYFCKNMLNSKYDLIKRKSETLRTLMIPIKELSLKNPTKL